MPDVRARKSPLFYACEPGALHCREAGVTLVLLEVAARVHLGVVEKIHTGVARSGQRLARDTGIDWVLPYVTHEPIDSSLICRPERPNLRYSICTPPVGPCPLIHAGRRLHRAAVRVL